MITQANRAREPDPAPEPSRWLCCFHTPPPPPRRPLLTLRGGGTSPTPYGTPPNSPGLDPTGVSWGGNVNGARNGAGEPGWGRVGFKRRGWAALLSVLGCWALGGAIELEVRVNSPWIAGLAVVLLLVALGLRLSAGLSRRRKRLRAKYVSDQWPKGSRPEKGRKRAVSAAAMGSQEEMATVDEARNRLREDPPPGLPEDESLLNVQLLRFVREHGDDGAKIERLFRKALEWKRANIPTWTQGELHDGGWLSAAEMPHGSWATQHVRIGLHCGYSKLGNPVKLERIGAYNIGALSTEPDARRRLNAFYLGLVDFLQQRLDQLSLEQTRCAAHPPAAVPCRRAARRAVPATTARAHPPPRLLSPRARRLQQTYEIFDLAGLSTAMLTLSTINFARDVLLNFATHYPSSFRKAVIINAPSFIPRFWGFVSGVLPNSVKAKVVFKGDDFWETLQEDLTEEALAWVRASHADLVRAPTPAGGAPPLERAETLEDNDDEDGGEEHHPS